MFSSSSSCTRAFLSRSRVWKHSWTMWTQYQVFLSILIHIWSFFKPFNQFWPFLTVSTGCWIESALFEMAKRNPNFRLILTNLDSFFPQGFAITVFGQFLHFWTFFASKIAQFICCDILALFAFSLCVFQKSWFFYCQMGYFSCKKCSKM